MRLRVLSSMCLAAGSLPALLGTVASGETLAATRLTDATGSGAAVRCLPAQYRDGAAAYRDCVAEAGETSPPALDALSFDERHALERACADAPDARACADAQLASLGSAPAPFLGALEADDRDAILRQCITAGGQEGVSAWRRCLDDAMTAVEALPRPGLEALSLPERGALAFRCATDGGTAADYRRCQLEALGQALDGPTLARRADDERAVARAADAAAETASDDADAAAAEDAEAVPTDDGAALVSFADGEGVAVAPPESRDATLDDADADADGADGDETADVVREATGATTRRVTLPADPAFDTAEAAVDEPLADEPVVTAQGTPATGAAEPLEDPEEAPSPDLGQRASDARDRLIATVGDLDGTERIVLFAALALPLLLLALWALGRGANRREVASTGPTGPLRNPALVERVAPSMQRAGGTGFHGDFDDETSDEEFFADLDRATGSRGDGGSASGLDRDRAAFVALDDTDVFDDDPLPDHGLDANDTGRDSGDGTYREASADAPAHSPAHAPIHAPIHAPADGPVDTPFAGDVEDAPRSTFGRWLSTREAPLRRQYAIEFLIYWMAYGDERYEPAFAEALLRDGGDDGDPHDLIKRHVLEADTLAFADVVRWVQSRCGELERVQVVDLLMVLLIQEGALTPVQNTLLHFLADAFGLGDEGLDRRHEEAFGKPMPALARTDLDAWWTRVVPESLPRWDARAIAALDERDQDRIRLGLPLDGELGESRIVEAFRDAARRCQPHRFDALGERERALAERQFAKFEEARDRLLGVRA